MSFGFSPSDLVSGLGRLWRLMRLLGGEAVGGFARFEDVYRDLLGTFRHIRRSVRDTAGFHGDLGGIRDLLGDFSSMIKLLQPYLGENRQSNSFLGSFVKMAWPAHLSQFQELREDIMFKLQNIMINESFRRQNMVTDDVFYLEDAWGEQRIVRFATVSTYEDLHEYLIGVSNEHWSGRERVRRGCYVIHKTYPAGDILCSSPSVKPFRNLIRTHERIQMSLIFPEEESDRRKCPKCGRERPVNISGAVVRCGRCDLQLRFRGARGNGPDTLTQIALNDIKLNGGMRSFVETFLREAGDPDDQRPRDIARDEPDLSRWVTTHEQELRPFGPMSDESEWQLDSLRHVTLCDPRWPDLTTHGTHQEAVREFGETIRGLERAVQYLEAEDFPFAKVAAFIGSRFWNARFEKSMLAFLESVLVAHRRRSPALLWLSAAAGALGAYIKQAEEGGAAFQASAVKLRCLLWIYSQTLDAEAKILHGCSQLLSSWALPEEASPRPKTPLFVKLFAMPHTVLLLPIWRVTFDLIEDIADFFRAAEPIHLPPGVRHFVTQSHAMSLHYVLDGRLDEYFQSPHISEGGLESGLTSTAGQGWMADVMRSEGTKLAARDVKRHLFQMMQEGSSCLARPK